jgi:hypothetical protein
MLKKYLIVLVCFCFSISSCDYGSDITDLKLENQDLSLAIPIINTKININELSENDQNSSLRIEPDGKITAIYNGELIRDNASSLFPPIPVVSDFPILSNDFALEIPFPDKYDIDKCIFKNTVIKFRYASATAGPITLNITSPSIEDDQGNKFNKIYTFNGGNADNKILSDGFDLTGFILYPANNTLNFIYTAKDANGIDIELSYLAMVSDIIAFSYVEGYFGKHRFPIQGDFITIGLFTNWISGGLFFEEPKVRLDVENGFGFPVRSEVTQLDIVSVDGEVRGIESQYIDTGIDFDFPLLNEVGVTKTTNFAFDKENSNVGFLLNERPARLIYDMSALANPDDDGSLTEFIGDESYFSVNVGVELPLYGKINDLVLADTFDLDLGEYDYIEDATFKLITNNEYPCDVYIQAYFIDVNNNTIDSVFAEDFKVISPALLPNGKTGPASDFITEVYFNKEKINKVLPAVGMRARVKMTTNGISTESLYVYDEYDISLKMGVVLNIKN